MCYFVKSIILRLTNSISTALLMIVGSTLRLFGKEAGGLHQNRQTVEEISLTPNKKNIGN
jgi:hypothetical protein